VTQAPALLNGVSHANVIADKGYDSNAIIDELVAHGNTPIIPARSCRTIGRSIDKHLYKERHLVENLFQKLRRNRRVAMRFDKLAVCYLAMVQLAAVMVLLV
jgi:transposase